MRLMDTLYTRFRIDYSKLWPFLKCHTIHNTSIRMQKNDPTKIRKICMMCITYSYIYSTIQFTIIFIK